MGTLPDSYLKLAKLNGEFIWRSHGREDELFMLLKGPRTIRLRDRAPVVGKGPFAVSPRGIEHVPVAECEVQVLLLEPKSTISAGDGQSERTFGA